MPPLGCSFHPRCQRAFEVCGWESRDLRALLEARWTKLPEPEFEAERALIGDLEELDEPATEALLPAASGHSGTEVKGVLDAMRADAPDDPFWKGVTGIEVEPRGVRVRFHAGIVPREVEVGSACVRCHLHDPEAVAAGSGV
jgi:peptide/nickel transport system ATP-binding protein